MTAAQEQAIEWIQEMKPNIRSAFLEKLITNTSSDEEKKECQSNLEEALAEIRKLGVAKMYSALMPKTQSRKKAPVGMPVRKAVSATDKKYKRSGHVEHTRQAYS
jgi:hypothetical protein